MYRLAYSILICGGLKYNKSRRRMKKHRRNKNRRDRKKARRNRKLYKRMQRQRYLLGDILQLMAING